MTSKVEAIDAASQGSAEKRNAELLAKIEQVISLMETRSNMGSEIKEAIALIQAEMSEIRKEIFEAKLNGFTTVQLSVVSSQADSGSGTQKTPPPTQDPDATKLSTGKKSQSSVCQADSTVVLADTQKSIDKEPSKDIDVSIDLLQPQVVPEKSFKKSKAPNLCPPSPIFMSTPKSTPTRESSVHSRGDEQERSRIEKPGLFINSIFSFLL